MAQTTDFEVNNLRKICVVTGTRAEYGLLMPVMNAIRCSGMELSIIATAMHLDPQFGNTVENIKKDGFVIDEVVEMPVNKDDTSHGVAQSIGNGIIGIANALLKIHPDIASLVPYLPGKPVEELERELGIPRAVKLASNENPLGPSPKALAVLSEAAETLNRYPDWGAHRLRAELADRYKVAADQVILERLR